MNILLGVTGSIAAYKSIELARLFLKNKHAVKVVMSKGAQHFIHPNSFAAITNHLVYTDLFDNREQTMPHIHLSQWADMIIICPATASIIGKLSSGIYDDLLTSICCAAQIPITIVPSMNEHMWKNPITQLNVKKLEENAYKFIYPIVGEQACGHFGEGRMEEPQKIVEHIFAPQPTYSLKGYNALVTAGPTIENIDAVRHISSKSSGKMGYAIADALHQAGACVSLITGPTHIAQPNVTKIINVSSTKEMHDAVLQEIDTQNIFISVAAISDYRPVMTHQSKLKKSAESLSLELERTEDILSIISLRKNKLLCTVGFAAETDNLIENAKNKLTTKHLDFIVANQITSDGFPLFSDQNEVTILSQSGEILTIPKSDKTEIAVHILRLIATHININNTQIINQ